MKQKQKNAFLGILGVQNICEAMKTSLWLFTALFNIK